MITIDLPTSDIQCNRYSLDKLKDQKGVYKIYSKEYELLYVGKSKTVKTRVENHIKGNTHTKGYEHLFYFVEVMYVENEMEMDIYETYLINALKPALNRDKLYEEVKVG